MPQPRIVAIGYIDDSQGPFHWQLDVSSSISFDSVNGVRRTKTGEWKFTFANPPVPNARVFVTTTGYAGKSPTGKATNCYGIVRQIDDHGFIVNTLSAGVFGSGLANTSFWFMVVQGDGVGFDGPGKEGPG